MANPKENDWLLNRVSNPNFLISDFKELGLNASNTSLEDATVYKDIPQIQSNPQFQTDGKFDEAKFNNVYKYMAETYNQFADDSYQEDITSQSLFHRDDIFADPKKRRQGPDIYFKREANPLQQTKGIIRLNLQEAPTRTIDEIAQTQKVLTNPVEVKNGAKPIYSDSPNDSLWSDFFTTRVMAQWDDEGDHIDTFSGEKVHHKKGDFKLNDQGTYYYENLDGRDVYGKKVLSKLNTLTTDGSWINKYDFFDSDDIDKSTMGSIARNVLTIAPMFIPGISPWYIGARVALQTSNVIASLGKIFTGSDNQFLSAVEGFSKSLDPTVSEHSQQSPWTVENFINLTGDVFKQLFEQRWIFKYGPAIFKNGKVMSEEAQDALHKQYLTKYASLAEFEKIKKGVGNSAEHLAELQATVINNAGRALSKDVEAYNKIGEVLSKAYMTGITVQDAYGEAKSEGASDFEAALLTLGYTAGEYGILSTQIGKWVLPELRVNKEQMRQVIKQLAAKQAPVSSTASKVAKYQWMKNIFNAGKNLAEGNYNVISPTVSAVKSTFANSMAEGLEEVSEELLYDFSKSLINLGVWMTGEGQKLTAWNNVADRYLMNFVGGAMGGAMFNAIPNFRAAKQMTGFTGTPEERNIQAMQQLVYMARNGKLGEFSKEVDKIQLGNKYLSATKMVDGPDGVKVWAQGTDEDNQDAAAKFYIRKQIKFVEDTLKANGAAISDESFLDIQTLKDLRFNKLKDSTVASHYLQEYNTLCESIVDYVNQLNNLNSPEAKESKGQTDAKEKQNGEDVNTKSTRADLESKLKEALEKKRQYLEGEIAPEFIYNSLFEMSTAISSAYMSPTLVRYAENKMHKPVTEIAQNDLDKIKKEYDEWRNGGKKDAIILAASMHKSIGKIIAPLFQEHSLKYYENFDNNIIDTLGALKSGINIFTKELNNDNNSETFLAKVNTYNSSTLPTLFNALIPKLATESDYKTFEDIVTTPTNEEYTDEIRKKQLTKFFDNFLVKNLSKIVDPIIAQGYINPEIKRVVLDSINTTYWKYMELEEESDGSNNAEIEEVLNKLDKAKTDILKLNHSNIFELLDNFALSTSNFDVKISNLMSEITDDLKSNSDSLSEFNLNNERIKQIKEALQVISITKAQVLSAKKNSADFDNLFGMNTTMNELDSEAHLAEIEAPIADSMIQDLELVEGRFNTFLKIIESNNAQKLGEQTRTDVNKNILIYDRIKQFTLNIPDNWKSKDKLIAVLDNLKKLEEINKSRKLAVSESDLKQINEEIIKLDDAIYDFFADNSEKVKDENALAEIINPKNFNLVSPNNDILNSETKSIDDNAIIWYLASRAALKSSDFYAEYRGIISDTIAPIPIQELGTYLGYSSIINGGVIDNFCNAVNKSLSTWAKEMSPKEFSDAIKYTRVGIRSTTSVTMEGISKDFILDSAISPRFSRTVFIEGISGSGKSSAVLRNIVTMLKTYHKDVLSDVWIAHSSEDNAVKLSKELGLPTADSMSRTKIMPKIAQDWKNYEPDKDGVIKIDDSAVFLDNNNISKSSLKINELSKVPSLIIIDEISQYTTLDLDLINSFAKKYGIPVLVFGDFDQSKSIGKYVFEYKGNSYNNIIQLNRNNFPRSPKLGISMRANNSQVSYNQKILRSLLPELILGADEVSMEFHYYQDENNIYGTKVYDKSSYNLELIKKDIELMTKNLLPGEKIGYIYYNADSELYKVLSSSTYKDKFDFKQGNSSQGLEGKYYIMEDSGEIDSSRYWSDIYTGVTRASEGTLLIHNQEIYKSNNSTEIYSVQDSSTSVNELSVDAVKKFSTNRREMLNAIELNANHTKIIKRDGDDSIPTVEIKKEVDEPVETLKSEEVKTKDEEGNEEKVIITNNSLASDTEMKARVLAASSDEKPLPKPGVSISHTSGNDSEIILDLLMYTFNTYETGTNFDNNGNLVVTDNNKRRLDSYFGLNKLSNIGPKNKENFDNIIGNIRSSIFNTKSKEELTAKLKALLNLKGDIYCTFAFKSSAVSFTNEAFGRFRKDIGSEYLNYIFSEDSKSKEVKLKTLSIIIGENDTDILELPLSVLPNPISVFKNEKFKSIREKYDEISRSNPDMSLNNKFKELIKFIRDNPTIEGGKAMENLLRVFNFTSNGIFYIRDNSWTLAKDFKSQGLSIVNKSKGFDYEYNSEVKYDGTWVTLDEFAKTPGISISKVKLSPKGIYNAGNKAIKFAKPGHAFVLMSDDVMLKDTQLEDYFYKQLEDDTIEKKVKLVYLVPPRASVKSYFDNLLNIISNNKSSIKRIGDDLTAYRILNILFAQPGFTESELNYNNTAFPEIKKIVDTLNEQSGDIQSQINTLDSPVNIQGLNYGISAKQALQNYLLTMVYPPNAENNSRIFKELNLKSIESILASNKIDGVFYNIQYSKTSSNETIMDAIYDRGSYSIDGNSFMVNGKIDSSSFYGNIASILDMIVSRMSNDDTSSLDNKRYINNNSNIFSEEKPNIEKVFKAMNINAPLSVQNELKIEDVANLSLDEILDIYKKSNHLVLNIGNNLYISQKSTLLSLENAVISDMSKLGLNITKFTLTIGSDVYNAEFDLNNHEVSLIKQGSIKGEKSPLTIFKAESIKEVGAYKTVLGVFNGLQIKKILDSKGVENFNDLINNARITKKVLGELRAELDNPDGFQGEQKAILQKLVDFFQAKLDSKDTLDENDNSCPITIKIKF